jgi:hypothetical protein
MRFVAVSKCEDQEPLRQVDRGDLEKLRDIGRVHHIEIPDSLERERLAHAVVPGLFVNSDLLFDLGAQGLGSVNSHRDRA